VGWGTGEDEEAGAILRVVFRPWGFFIFDNTLKTSDDRALASLIACDMREKVRRGGSLAAASQQIRCERTLRALFIIALSALLVFSEAGFVFSEGDVDVMKRRQQGLLTGMPFMANLAPRTFVDAFGRKVFLSKAPSRVVSMAPNVTEILFALGAGDQLAAVTQFCDFPPEARGKTQLRGTNPSAEQIVALKPDLVLVPQDFMKPDLLQQLERLKVPTFVLKATSVEDVLSQILTMARMLDRQREGDTVAAAMRRRLAVVSERVHALSRTRVLYVLNSDPLQTVGPGSFIHQLIDLAGGENIAPEGGGPYPRLSVEDVIARDPQVLIFPSGADEGIPDHEREQWRKWPSLSAVKRNRLVSVPSVLVDRPGPRIVEGLEMLARVIHPELSDLDLQGNAP
jgi:iron complex transport system substrate-binding protein